MTTHGDPVKYIAIALAIPALFAGGGVLTSAGSSPPPAVMPAATVKASNRYDASGSDATLFENKVRPLLLDRCSKCHGDGDQRGGLRLDSEIGMRHGGASGLAVAPGDPDKSLLVRAIRYDGSIKMPPAGKMSDAEIAVLTDWVRRGAVWPKEPKAPLAAQPVDDRAKWAKAREFWSFRPIQNSPTPSVKLKSWVKSPIDAFVLSRLEAKGLGPAPKADRRTLVRRATFDLTGLPPTPEEVAQFLSDRSPDAFAHVVDRLLASPRYGERWGRHWLDVVRYADSADARGLGSEGDISEAWRYRDWVVNAFNQDLPYNQFVMNQIAGDLLPPAGLTRSAVAPSTSNSRLTSTIAASLTESSARPTAPEDFNVSGTIATGMLAIGNWGNGDADKDKILTDIADDQVDVVSRAFMGLTVACARCHDHKFDPIPTKDYYGLAGIFFSSHILPNLTPKGQGENMLRVALITAAERAERDRYAVDLTAAEGRLKSAADSTYRSVANAHKGETAAYVLAAWDWQHRPAFESAVSLAAWAESRSMSGPILRRWLDYLGWDGDYRLLTQTVRNTDNPGVFSWRGVPDCPNLTVNTTDKALQILTFTLPPRSLCVHPGPTNGVAIEWVSPIKGAVHVTGGVKDADPACGDGIAWIVDHRGQVGYHELTSGEFTNGGEQTFPQSKSPANLDSVAVNPGDRIQLLVLPKGDYFCDTTVVNFVVHEKGGSHTWDVTSDMLDDPLRANPRADRYGNSGVWRFTDMGDSNRAKRPGGAEAPQLASLNQHVGETIVRDDVAAAAQEFARQYDVTSPDSPFMPHSSNDEDMLASADRARLAELRGAVDVLKKNAPAPPGFANAIQEGGVPGTPHAGIHDVHVHIRGRYDRLGDLVPRHFPIVVGGDTAPPITSGSGRLQLAQWLVNGKHPTVARVMVNRIWQHHFGEGIVRTPSNFGFLGERPTHPELLDWLAYTFESPTGCDWSMKKLHRLIMLSSTYQQSSEPTPATLKADPDNRLFGRMSRHRLEAEAIRDSLLAVSGHLDTAMGGLGTRDFNSGRRTLYVMTVRSDRSGYGPLFDVADPTASVEKRTVSTVAPQALFLLNNPFVLDQARLLAERLIKECPQGPTLRIQAAYELLYGRPASRQELVTGLAFLVRAARAAPVKAGARAGESQETFAWQEYAHLLLCANEFIYVD